MRDSAFEFASQPSMLGEDSVEKKVICEDKAIQKKTVKSTNRKQNKVYAVFGFYVSNVQQRQSIGAIVRGR